MRYVFQFLTVFFCIALVVSCNSSSTCLTPKSVALRGGFYVKQTDSVLGDSILENANVIFSDAQIFYGFNLKQSSKFQSSLSAASNKVAIYFQSDSTTTAPSTIDTIEAIYTSKLNFISTACGYEYFYTLNSISSTHQVIDTVLLKISEITSDVSKEHISIVLKK